MNSSWMVANQMSNFFLRNLKRHLGAVITAYTSAGLLLAGACCTEDAGACPGRRSGDAQPGATRTGRAECRRVGPARRRTLAAGVALLGLLCAVAPARGEAGEAPLVAPRVTAVLPHDPGAFTQGLFFAGGRLFETTGLRGASRIMELDPASGRVLRVRALPDAYFGEGATAVGELAVWLTWTSGRAFVLGLDDFAPRGEFAYSGQGWGLTGDGRVLYMSDGSDVLTVRDPQTFAVLGRLEVRDGGAPVELLNELEWADGEILANVWHSARVAAIDPATGRVRRWLDLGALVPPGLGPEAVANGLAWDADARRLYATGKLWPVLYVLDPGPVPAP